MSRHPNGPATGSEGWRRVLFLSVWFSIPGDRHGPHGMSCVKRAAWNGPHRGSRWAFLSVPCLLFVRQAGNLGSDACGRYPGCRAQPCLACLFLSFSAVPVFFSEIGVWRCRRLPAKEGKRGRDLATRSRSLDPEARLGACGGKRMGFALPVCAPFCSLTLRVFPSH